MPSPDNPVWITVLAPAHNEEQNVEPLVREVEAAIAPAAAARNRSWEFILVDDGSTDATRATAAALASTRPWLRVIAMTRTPKGKGAGQSAAFHAGIRAARGELIATLDADLQNAPADFPKLIDLIEREHADLAQGDRSRARKDNLVRRVGSVVGRLFRRWLLADQVRDTGCSLRVMKREYALLLPLQFRGAHRFIPVTIARLGGRVVEMDVSHRPRTAGETKYGLGILQRAIPGLLDLFVMRWMFNRRRWTDSAEVTATSHNVVSSARERAGANAG
ncbi:MAG: glycosyltransferase family 2 protein [Phycisphaerales bacterium]